MRDSPAKEKDYFNDYQASNLSPKIYIARDGQFTGRFEGPYYVPVLQSPVWARTGMGVEEILTQKHKGEKDSETPDEGRGFFFSAGHAGHCSPYEYQVSLTTEYRMKNKPPAGFVNIDNFGGRMCPRSSIVERKPSKLMTPGRYRSRAPYAPLAQEQSSTFVKYRPRCDSGKGLQTLMGAISSVG
jgi:hypothetical protein